jgi:hypothetical protein
LAGLKKIRNLHFIFFSDFLEIRVGGSVNQEIKKLWPYIEKKIFFSRTSSPISIKLGINHPWVNGVLFYKRKFISCSNKGSGPVQRGDNLKNAKMGWVHLKIFSRTTEPE